MKDLFEKLLRFIPSYVENLLALVGGPKRYVAAIAARNELSLEKGLIFLAVSFAISWIIKAPLLRLDPLIELGSDAIAALAMVLAYGAALCLAWRVAGGHGVFRPLFAVHLHYAGVLLLISAGTFLTAMGLLRAFDASLYKEVTEAVYAGRFPQLVLQETDRLAASSGFRGAMLVALAGLAVGVLWILIGWGAYRSLSGLNRLRSVVAAMLFVILSAPVAAVLFLMANVLVK